MQKVPPLAIPVRYGGSELDFTFAGFDVPVVKRTVQEAIERVASSDGQFFPVTVAGIKTEGEFSILNVTRRRVV